MYEREEGAKRRANILLGLKLERRRGFGKMGLIGGLRV